MVHLVDVNITTTAPGVVSDALENAHFIVSRLDYKAGTVSCRSVLARDIPRFMEILNEAVLPDGTITCRAELLWRDKQE
jgi:hypothetical protein